MPYTEAFIMESQRCTPIADFTVMHSTTSDVQFGQYSLPKDTGVSMDYIRPS